MPLVNSILSWQCPLLSLAVLLCCNYLLVTSINKSNWAQKISQAALAILLVDYIHRITVIHVKLFRFLRLSYIGVPHGPQCYDEENCRDFLGDLPNSLVTGFVALKAGVVRVVPEKYAVHAIVLVVSVIGLLIEVYVSFMNLLVFSVNFILIVAGLHRADLLKHFVAPILKLYYVISEYHGHVTQAVTSMEESFVNELNDAVTSSNEAGVTNSPEERSGGHCVLTAAMSEMCAGVPVVDESELTSQSVSSRDNQHGPLIQHAAALESDDDSDIGNDDSLSRPVLNARMFDDDSDDSLLLNDSRIPSPTRSWSSTEELVPSKALFLAENDSDTNSGEQENDDDDDLSLSQIGVKERARRKTLADNGASNSDDRTPRIVESGEPSLITNTISAGFQAITNLAFRAFDSGIVVDVNAQKAAGDSTRNAKRATAPNTAQGTEGEDFVFVDTDRDSFGDVYERDTLPTTLQMDSQGPYTFYYETRSRTRKVGKS